MRRTIAAHAYRCAGVHTGNDPNEGGGLEAGCVVYVMCIMLESSTQHIGPVDVDHVALPGTAIRIAEGVHEVDRISFIESDVS